MQQPTFCSSCAWGARFCTLLFAAQNRLILINKNNIKTQFDHATPLISKLHVGQTLSDCKPNADVFITDVARR